MKVKKAAVRAVNKLLTGLGLQLVRPARNDAFIEGGLRKILTAYGVDCVIDVGANAGQYGTMLRRIGFQGTIFSFEPVKECYAALAETSAKDPNWSARALALGASKTQREIRRTRFSLLSSFLKPSDFASEVFGEQIEVVDSELVEVRRLDQILPQLLPEAASRRIFLKTDTQGFDLEVLEGAGDLMHQLIGLQIELSAIPLYEQMPDYLQSLEKLRGMGFEAAGFYPIFRQPDSLTIAEFDCFMVRRDLPTEQRRAPISVSAS